MGIGMVAVVAPDTADRAVDLLTARGLPAWVLGSVTSGDGTVTLHGQQPS
jgi:phosphoribosylformylglycinamidine cyclo-ligase